MKSVKEFFIDEKEKGLDITLNSNMAYKEKEDKNSILQRENRN